MLKISETNTLIQNNRFKILTDIKSFFTNSKKVIFKYLLWIIAFAILYVIVEFKIILFIEYFDSPSQWFWKIYGLVATIFLLSRFLLADLYFDKHLSKFINGNYPSVSVIIAAKNEEDNIYRTIETVMVSNYPGELECIAVNDGSTDNTYLEMKKSAEAKFSNKRVHVISYAKNKGKREAMALGFNKSIGKIIVFIDSDSFVDKNGIKILVEHFIEDAKIGAATGNTGVENRDANLLTKMQSARYGVAYNIFKVSESIFGAVTCCSGCFSAYRRSAVEEVIEPWRNQKFLGSKSTFGDDRSLTNFILKNWKVIYCSTAYATTIVPDTFKVFLKQQLRWKKSWIREGWAASKFMWKKHPIAAMSFYANLILPVIGPFMVLYGLFLPTLTGILPIFYIGGVIMMSFLFGIFYRLRTVNTVWWHVVFFSLFYIFILVWQMPYALFKLRDTSWGTR